MNKEVLLDDWQKEILDYQGDILLCKGRRIGGTEIFSIKAAKTMIDKPNSEIVFVSLTEDQAKLCINVALEWLNTHHKKMIGKGKNKPQVGKITLTNGSTFQVRPVGATGNAVRGFNGTVLGVDEAAFQPAVMWAAVRPILTTTNGHLWLWGTPNQEEGYFYEQFERAYVKKDPNARFKVWYKTTEEVLLQRPISDSWTEKQREGALRIIEEERKTMSKAQFANEYEGKFLSQIRRLFSDEWIENVCTLKEENHLPRSTSALGVDVAGMGEDESTFEGLELMNEELITQFYHEKTTKTSIPQTEEHIILLNQKFSFDYLGIDDGGIGRGLYEYLLRNDELKNKTFPLNNARKIISSDGKENKLLKEDMYYTTLAWGEGGKLKLFDAQDLKTSLRSIRVEEDGRIAGRYSHIVEGIIRAVQLLKGKSLNLSIYSFKV